MISYLCRSSHLYICLYFSPFDLIPLSFSLSLSLFLSLYFSLFISLTLSLSISLSLSLAIYTRAKSQQFISLHSSTTITSNSSTTLRFIPMDQMASTSNSFKLVIPRVNLFQLVIPRINPFMDHGFDQVRYSLVLLVQQSLKIP